MKRALVFTVVLSLALAIALARRLEAAPEWRPERVDRFLLDSMRAGGIDAWILLSREGHFDPLSEDFGLRLGRAALVFRDRGGERAERTALVSSLDVVPLRESGIYDRVETFGREESFADRLASFLSGLDAERIGVDMSQGSGIADGLSASDYELLKRSLGSRSNRIVSAETAVLSFRSKKLPQEVELYRRAAAATQEILIAALTDGFLHPGVTTQKELHDYVQELARRRGFPELAWDRESCPGVYSGLFRDLSHADPRDVVIMPGDILWVDFGIRLDGYATDMIRAAYLLRPGETEAPPEVAKMFETLKRANEAAMRAMKPGVLGWEVDRVAREVVTEAGYPEFFHATGHPVGREVHDAGPALGPKGPRYGSAVDLPLERDQIFAVEPSVMRRMEELGGAYIINMEEEVLVTADGAEYLAPHQTELVLVPAP